MSQEQQEQLTELFSFQMTAREKQLLRTLAYEQGATLSGLLRKLIRDAGWKYGDASLGDPPKAIERREARNG